MPSNLEFDRRALEKAVKDAAKRELKERAHRAQQVFDLLSQQYRGRPISEVRPVLRREWERKLGVGIPDPELTEYAEHVAGGTRIDFRVDPKWR